jgi:uncharacterized protein YecE (DUF72 family)
LRQYSQAFNTVEGNSSFYGIPSIETAQRWASETEPGFHFALKFPRVISHERQLTDCETELRMFLDVLEVLADADRLGPSFLQLSASFENLERLTRFLDLLPSEYPYAVEVRHPCFFAHGREEQSLDELLTTRSIDRVLFDSRAIFNGPPNDIHEEESQRRKPQVPLRRTVTGRHPLVRFVGRNDVAFAREELTEWAPVVAAWIAEGLEPYIFTHAPADKFAPVLARLFHTALRAEAPDVPPLPDWPGEHATDAPRQRDLF